MWLMRGTLAGRAEAGSSGRGDAIKEESEVGEGRMGKRKGEREGKRGKGRGNGDKEHT